MTDRFTRLETNSAGIIRDDMPVTLTLPPGFRSALGKADLVAKSETVKTGSATTLSTCVRSFHLNSTVRMAGHILPVCLPTAWMTALPQSAMILRVVPLKYPPLGSENQIKGYPEDATNAAAGVIVTRPAAITRLTGL
ncbi:hypothetical protein [Erwinia amylovora]|uniref:hypothetical protein n=1 Tax=Erwinia amylovora TaxID=552 RepID=UPI001F044701|nr:hypothetical protein [Erwinia amylovora]